MHDLPDGLRAARLDDADPIADYFVRCWQVSFRRFVPPEVLAFVESMDMDERRALWRERIAPDSDQTVVVAVGHTDQAIGHVMVEGAELVHLFIDPDHHRQGWGRILLAEGEHLIVEAGHGVAKLHVAAGNTAAIALYEATGWSMTDERITNDMPNGASFDEHVMRKVLTR
ncbi:MAG: GNAT family N-acetyltransferase [Actinomycetota bacterium]